MTPPLPGGGARTALQGGGLEAVGNYAGPFSRLAAYAIDAVLMATLFSVTTAASIWIVELVTARQIDSVHVGALPSMILFAAWFLLYFGGSWAIAGRTLGMALFGLRVVRRDGSRLDARHAWARAITFPLSFLFFGLGFVGIVIGRRRSALHDMCADTSVVYDWDADAARLRNLARSRPSVRPTTP